VHALAQAQVDTLFPLDADALAEEIGVPLQDWPRNCHAIASKVLQMVPVKGMRLARGHFTGYISPRSQYTGGGPSQQHTWLVAEDGRILDPTRWAMETPGRPTIYLGANDNYDEAGLELAASIGPMLFPLKGVDPYADRLSKVSREGLTLISKSLGVKAPDDTNQQSQDMARLAFSVQMALKYPPEHLEDPTAFFSAMAGAGMKALVKIDVWNMIMEPQKLLRQGEANRWFELPAMDRPSPPVLFFELCNRFISIEERDLELEIELEELGYTLDNWHEALNTMESLLKYKDLYDHDFGRIPRDYLDMMVVVSGDVLGKGFGTNIRVERYAASRGYSRKQLDAVVRAAGERVGYTSCWI